MPILDWLGKDKVINHHRAVPVHFLDKKFSVGTSANKIIHGDNLLALKSLLPEFAGRVKCIYIDPPYNTGNEGWVYNDAVNDPQIKRWLGQVVGKDGEDFTRHDKWLCMMYPRLRLLQKLLADDGAIFISIDDNEQANLKLICDEIFGAQNFVANVIWEKKYSPQNDARWLSDSHDFVLLYAENKNIWRPNLLPRTAEMDARYKNPDNDPRGAWKAADFSAKTYSPSGDYPITTPSGRIVKPPPSRAWITNEENFQKLVADNRIWFGVNGNNVPAQKKFLPEVQGGTVSKTIWLRDDVGDNQDAKREVKSLGAIFDTPKPTRLLEKILRLATDKDSLILDSFAGSGTTAHAVINLNAADGGNRRFILIELMDYAESITAERVRRVGGSFDFYELGEPLFDEAGCINNRVTLEQLREYIYFSETGKHYAATAEENLLGVDDGIAYYLFQGRELNYDLLATIETRATAYVIYADSCTLSENFLDGHGITFKKLPRDVRRY